MDSISLTRENPFIVTRDRLREFRKNLLIGDNALEKALAGETIYVYAYRAYFKVDIVIAAFYVVLDKIAGFTTDLPPSKPKITCLCGKCCR